MTGIGCCARAASGHAAAVVQPNDFALTNRNLGYRRLGDTSQALRDFQFNVTAVNRAWGMAHKETLVRFARAWA